MKEDNRYKNIPNETIASVYQKKGANISATCTALGISRQIFYKWRNERKELDELLTEVEESLIDFTESKLMEQISDGNITAILFHLKTKGKKRGYVESIEQNVSVNPFIELMKNLPDDAD